MLVTLYRNLQLLLSKTIIIGDTKYHIKCSLPRLHITYVQLWEFSSVIQGGPNYVLVR